MRFEILYLLAKFRGIFYKKFLNCSIFIAQTNKELLKELYITHNCIPYRTNKDGTEFL